MSVWRILLAAMLAGTLGGCGSLNTWAARSLGEHVPQWAGGLPPDAPPRPGTPEYDEYKRKLQGNVRHAPGDDAARRPDVDFDILGRHLLSGGGAVSSRGAIAGMLRRKSVGIAWLAQISI